MESNYKSLVELKCGFLSGYAFKSSWYSKSGLPLIKIGNIQNRIVEIDVDGNFIPNNIINDKLEKYCVNDGDVLIAMTGQGSVGRVGKMKIRNSETVVLNQRVGKFICDEENLNLDYLFYVLTSDKYQDFLFNTGSGSGQPNLSPELILSTEIPYFSYTEQKAIASVLSSLDDKIDLLHQQNQTLEALAETIFRQWFIEEAKEDWEVGKISDLVNLFNGKVRPNEGGNVPIYGGNGIMGYTSEFNYSGKSIIIGRVGAYCGSLYYDNKNIWVSDNALLVKGKYENTMLYLFYLLRTLNLNSMAEGSSHPLLTQTLIKSIEITMPPIQKINQFDKIVSFLQKKTEENQQQIQTLTNLRDTLLTKLMSGEIRVKH